MNCKTKKSLAEIHLSEACCILNACLNKVIKKNHITVVSGFILPVYL